MNDGSTQPDVILNTNTAKAKATDSAATAPTLLQGVAGAGGASTTTSYEACTAVSYDEVDPRGEGQAWNEDGGLVGYGHDYALNALPLTLP